MGVSFWHEYRYPSVCNLISLRCHCSCHPLTILCVSFICTCHTGRRCRRAALIFLCVFCEKATTIVRGFWHAAGTAVPGLMLSRRPWQIKFSRGYRHEIAGNQALHRTGWWVILPTTAATIVTRVKVYYFCARGLGWRRLGATHWRGCLWIGKK